MDVSPIILHACRECAKRRYCSMVFAICSTQGFLADGSIKFMIHHATEMRDRILKRESEEDDIPLGSGVATGERSIPPKDKKRSRVRTN